MSALRLAACALVATCVAALDARAHVSHPSRAIAQDPAANPPENVPPREPATDAAAPNAPAPSQEPVVESATQPIPTQATSALPSGPAADAYATPWIESAYETELARLVAAHPSRARLTSLGASKQGRRIALLTIGDLASEPDRRPAALLATDLEARFGERPGGPEAALYAARALLERADREPETAELLAGVTLYVVPAPDPDGAFSVGSAVERTCRLERNFPAGWQPSDAIDCPQGPYPCSEPETRELARLVAQRTNVGALALLAKDGVERGDGTLSIEPSLARVAARAGLDANELEIERRAALAQPGGLAAFACARVGACVLALDPWKGKVEGDVDANEPVRAGFRALPVAVEALLRELPRLDGKSVRAERLRERLWLVELELRVAGGLPTASADERSKAPASVWLDVDGARVSRVGLRREGEPVANLDVPRGKSWRIGHLAGNESVRLYMTVEGDEGGKLDLAFRSLRGGTARFDLPLGG